MANILINSDFENGSGDRTTEGWLGNSSAYGTYLMAAYGTLSFQATAYHGSQAIKLDVGQSSWLEVSNVDTNDTNAIKAYCPAITGNTKYKLTGWQKSDGFSVGVQGLCVYIREFDSDGAVIVNLATDGMLGTQDWTEVTHTWTTHADAAYIGITYIRAHGDGGATGDLYADYFSLEEVGEEEKNNIYGYFNC